MFVRFSVSISFLAEKIESQPEAGEVFRDSFVECLWLSCSVKDANHDNLIICSGVFLPDRGRAQIT